MKERVIVRKERHYSAHHYLLHIARLALKDAEDNEQGRTNNQFICMTFSALAVEALANAFGERLISHWSRDFESASPVAKLRIISDKLEVPIDFEKPPWSTALWLKSFRNNVAHAKPKLIVEEEEVSHESYEKDFYTAPKSKLEKDITMDKARSAYKAVSDIQSILIKQLSDEVLEGLLSDGWSGSASLQK